MTLASVKVLLCCSSSEGPGLSRGIEILTMTQLFQNRTSGPRKYCFIKVKSVGCPHPVRLQALTHPLSFKTVTLLGKQLLFVCCVCFETGSMQCRLALSSFCSPGWPQPRQSSCLCWGYRCTPVSSATLKGFTILYHTKQGLMVQCLKKPVLRCWTLAKKKNKLLERAGHQGIRRKKRKTQICCVTGWQQRENL